MVALNEQFTLKNPSLGSGNRVGDFFCEVEPGVGNNRLAGRFATKGKSSYSYELASGRSNWLSRDPIAENGGINLYAYVGNNPINAWDPFGEIAFGGAALGFLSEGVFQYLEHGTNFKCWSKKDLAIGAGQGALGLGVVKNAGKAYRSYKKYRKIKNQFPKGRYIKQTPAHEVPGELAQAGGKAAAGAAANEFKDRKNDRSDSDCE
jgi:uncharacterized protein RhaS with RHS repeats